MRQKLFKNGECVGEALVRGDGEEVMVGFIDDLKEHHILKLSIKAFETFADYHNFIIKGV